MVGRLLAVRLMHLEGCCKVVLDLLDLLLLARQLVTEQFVFALQLSDLFTPVLVVELELLFFADSHFVFEFLNGLLLDGGEVFNDGALVVVPTDLILGILEFGFDLIYVAFLV